MPRRILVPLDGSRTSEAALWHAIAVVDALADGLMLLHVLADARGDAGGVEDRFLRTEAAAYLDQTADRLEAEGVDVVTAVAAGGVASEIVRAAKRDEISLVVLTSHGRGAASDFAFGGTVHKVLSRVPTSVMVVRPPSADERAGVPIHYDRVLVPVDGSSASEWALFPAASIAQRHGAKLHVLHLVPEIPRTADRLPPSSAEEDLLRQLGSIRRDLGDRYLRQVEDTLSRDDLSVEGHLVATIDPAEGVTAAAAEHGVDLIALDARCATNTHGRVGSVARRLLEGSRLPVIVLQDAASGIGREATRRLSGAASTG